jgi:hypothetical protein
LRAIILFFSILSKNLDDSTLIQWACGVPFIVCASAFQCIFLMYFIEKLPVRDRGLEFT